MKSVLLIEDDKLIAELEARPLTKAGLTVTMVETREDAARAIAASPPDLIFTDLQLAEGSAEDTVNFLAQLAHDYPVVICSGHYETERGVKLRAACKAAGCVDYLDKYDLAVMGARLAKTLTDSYQKFHATR